MLKWAVFPKPAEFRRRIVVRHSFSVFKWCILFILDVTKESWAWKWPPILKMTSAYIQHLKYAKDTAMLNDMSDPTKIRNPSTRNDSSLFAIMGWLLFSLLSAGSSSWQFFEAVTISRAHLSRLVDKGAVLLVSMTICLFGNHHLKPFSAYSVCFFLIQLCTFLNPGRLSQMNVLLLILIKKAGGSCAQLTCWASLISSLSAWLVGWLFHIVLFSSSLLSYIKIYKTEEKRLLKDNHAHGRSENQKMAVLWTTKINESGGANTNYRVKWCSLNTG